MTGAFAGPEDFVVEEAPLYAATGEGGHTFVFVEKRLLNTEDVVRVLARVAGVSGRDVGYAGRKDRFAVTRQWLSVPGLDPAVALAIDAPGLRVLSAVRHPHKLRVGHLAANRFDICVRGVSESTVGRAEAARGELTRVGMPNRFGAQRFGRDDSNVVRAQKVLAAGRSGTRDRRHARFLLSALQAAVFNEVLRRRPLPLDRVECGDMARKTDSGGLFVVEDEAVENERAARFEISATGPMFGTRVEQPAGAVAQRESEVLEHFGVATDFRAPPGIRLRGARRPLRVAVADLDLSREHANEDGSCDLRLRFTLPSGSYATVALEELLGFVPTRSERDGA